MIRTPNIAIQSRLDSSSPKRIWHPTAVLPNSSISPMLIWFACSTNTGSLADLPEATSWSCCGNFPHADRDHPSYRPALTEPWPIPRDGRTGRTLFTPKLVKRIEFTDSTLFSFGILVRIAHEHFSGERRKFEYKNCDPGWRSYHAEGRSAVLCAPASCRCNR